MDNGNISINIKQLHCKGRFHWTVFFVRSEIFLSFSISVTLMNTRKKLLTIKYQIITYKSIIYTGNQIKHYLL